MLWVAGVLFLLALFSSFFFSGTETAYYRASRVKIVMRALEGDRLSKFLVWLTNHPAFMVGTLLIGNNIANYLVSFSIVMGVTFLFVDKGSSAEMMATLLLTPLLFIFGEAFPKRMSFQAPNRWLRWGAFPLFLVAILLLPLSGILWAFSRILERFIGQSPEKLSLSLARKELEQVLEEGQQVGILHPSQRLLSQNFFLVAGKSIKQICLPINRLISIRQGSRLADAIRLAQRHGLTDIPVSSTTGELIGYYHLIDLLIRAPHKQDLPTPRPLQSLMGDEPFAEAILWMQTHRETLVKVVNKQNQPLGLLASDQLTSQLLRGSLESLRR